MVTAIKIMIVIVSVILVLLVAAQESRSDGLSGSIGGGAEQLFGKKRANAYDRLIHRATIVMSVILLILSVVGLIKMA